MNHQATGCCCTCHCMYFLVQLLLLLMILFLLFLFYDPCCFHTVIAIVAIDVIVAVAPDAVDFAAIIITVVIMYVYAVNVAVYSIDAPSAANITVFVSCLVYAVALVLLLFLCSGYLVTRFYFSLANILILINYHPV